MMHDDNGLDNPRVGNLPGQSVEMIMVDRCSSVFGSEELTIGQMGPGRIRHCHRGPCRGRLGVAHPRNIGPERSTEGGWWRRQGPLLDQVHPNSPVIRPSSLAARGAIISVIAGDDVQIRAGTTRCASRVNVGGKFRCGLSARPPATISVQIAQHRHNRG